MIRILSPPGKAVKIFIILPLLMKAGKPSRLIDAQPLERGTDIAVDDELEPVDKQLRSRPSYRF